jgi:hypothetical protein
MISADESEFDALQVLAVQLRMAKNPTVFMDSVVKEWHNELAEEDLAEGDGDTKIPPIPGYFIPPEELDGLDGADSI